MCKCSVMYMKSVFVIALDHLIFYPTEVCAGGSTRLQHDSWCMTN